MNYNQNECPVCKKEFEQNDDIVVCPVCGTPHHRNCWNENGKCSNEELHAEGFVWQNKNPVEVPSNKNQGANVKVCPVCGAENDQIEPVCTSCGTRLSSSNGNAAPFNTNPQFTPFPNGFSNFNNVYASDAIRAFGENAKVDDISVAEMAEYIQKDSIKYIGKFKDMEEKKTKLSWNWSAFFGNIFWMFYRKMIGIGVLFICLFISVSLLSSILVPAIFKTVNPAEYDKFISAVEEMNEEMLKSYENGTTQNTEEYYRLLNEAVNSAPMIASYVVQLTSMLIMNVVMGFFGTTFYKSKIKKDILAIRKIAADQMTYHVYLHHRGGASVINIILPVMLYSMFLMFMLYL